MRDKEKGVTLIELIIVFVLIIIITGAVRINAGRYGKFLSVEREAMKVAQDIREMSNKARAMERVPSGSLPAGIIDDYEKGRYMTLYGIRAEGGASEYQKVAYIIDKEAEDILGEIKLSQGLILETVSLEQGKINASTIADAYFENGVIKKNEFIEEVKEIEIVFISSEPKIYIYGVGYYDAVVATIECTFDADYVDMIISSKDNSETRSIRVKDTGLIEVN